MNKIMTFYLRYEAANIFSDVKNRYYLKIFPSLAARSGTWGRRIRERTGRADVDRWKAKETEQRFHDSGIVLSQACDSKVPSIVPRRLVSAAEESGVVRHTERSRGCQWKLWGVDLMKIESMGPGYS